MAVRILSEEETMSYRSTGRFFVLAILLSSLVVLPAPAQAAREQTVVPVLLRIDSFVETVRNWLRGVVVRPRPGGRKCGGGIDPNGKPCP
jgi:hypothetical protein